MKIGSTFNHEVYGPLKITKKRYSRMGNKSLWIGVDENGEEHELDGTEKPAKMEKESPKFLKEAAEVLGMAQGPKGEDADEDFIIEAVIPRVLEQIRQPENGKDGADADVELIIREMLPLVMEKMPRPKELNEALIIQKVVSRIRIPQDGKPGEKGKDGSPDTAVQVKEKLETLKGDERLDASAIKNLPKQVTQIGGGHSYTGLAKVDATGTPGTLQEKIVAGTNVTITKINDTLRIASSGGGGGGGQVDSIVAGNNIDVDATDPANPIVSVETLTLADISDITASATEVNYIDGVTSAIQPQLDGKFTLQGANVVNELGADVDQRFEGDTDQNLLFLDAGNDRIGIGTATPAEKLEVNGNIKMTASGAVFTHVDTGKINIDGVNVGINEGNPTQRLVVNGTVRVYTGGGGYYLVDRGGTSDEAFYQIQSAGSNKWSLGMLGDATQNFRLYNNVLSASAMSIASADSVVTFAADVNVPDEAYGAGWDGSLEVPTKNALYDKIETLGGGGNVSKVGTPVDNQVGVWTGDGTLEGDSDLTFDGTTLSAGGLIDASLTASEIVITNGSKKLVSAAVATYPSLTELTYVKGVTSAIQTQLGTKQATITFGTGVQTALGVNVGSAGAPVLFNGALGTPSSGTATNLTGTASGLTAGNVTTNANLTGPVTSTGNATAIADAALSIAKTSGLQTALDAKLALAGGTMTGSITLGENTSIALDPAGSADGKYSGITVTGTAGATLAFGDLIYLDPTDSRWELCDGNAAAGADGDARGMIGMCVLAAAADGNATTILLQGIIRADANFPALTIGAPVYVAETAGDVVVTQPTTTDAVIRQVGFAMTADELYFNPTATWTTHT